MEASKLQQLKYAADNNRNGRSSEEIPPREFINVSVRDFCDLVDLAASHNPAVKSKAEAAAAKPGEDKPGK